MRPTVSFPHLPENTKTIDEVGDVKIDQVVIGSCTNGRISDLKIAADILKGHKIAKNVRCIVIPGTQQIYLDALHAGYFDIFIAAGCAVSTPTCGPCLGGHMGILAEGERCVATTNRNFVGRMGHVKSEVYLASPAVAAASAIEGKQISFHALEDNGNRLKEPFSGAPVIVCDGALAGRLSPASPERIRLIPCSTVTGDAVLEAFRPDCVRITYKGREIITKDVYIAKSKEPIRGEYEAVLNSQIID